MYPNYSKKPSTNKLLGKTEIYSVDLNSNDITSVDSSSDFGQHLLDICRRYGKGQSIQPNCFLPVFSEND